MKNSNTKIKLIARVMLLVLLLASAVNFVGCEWMDYFTITTERGPLKTTKPTPDMIQNIPNTFETTETTVDLENGEKITIIHGKDFNEDDIEFLLMLHGQRRNDGVVVDLPMGYSLKDIITAGKNGDSIFLAHFENPYIICAYTSEREEEKFYDYNFDVTEYVWYKFYNSEQIVDETEGMERTKDTYLLYDCIVERDIVNKVEYNKNCKCYMEYRGKYVLQRITPDMILYVEFNKLSESEFILFPEYGGGAHEVYIDETGEEYLYFSYRACTTDGFEIKNIAIDIFGEHYTSLLDRFEILNEVVNEDGYILQYAGIGLDDLELYESE